MKSKGIASWVYTTNLDKKYEQWKVTLEMDKNEYKKLKAVGINPKVVINDETDEVSYFFTFTRKLKRRGKSGGTNPAPKVVDSQLNPFDGIVGNGSEVIVLHKPYDWEYKGKKGVGTDFCALQILQLVEYVGKDLGDGEVAIEDDDEGFEAVDGFVAATPEDKKKEKSKDEVAVEDDDDFDF